MLARPVAKPLPYWPVSRSPSAETNLPVPSKEITAGLPCASRPMMSAVPLVSTRLSTCGAPATGAPLYSQAAAQCAVNGEPVFGLVSRNEWSCNGGEAPLNVVVSPVAPLVTDPVPRIHPEPLPCASRAIRTPLVPVAVSRLPSGLPASTGSSPWNPPLPGSYSIFSPLGSVALHGTVGHG
jgi:hypothetical protein